MNDAYAFGRWGWDEGQHESFCYTEDNEGVRSWCVLAGTNWHRSLDRAGAAFVSSGLSKAHQAYLAYGGLGFLLGDGGLDYGRENIEEVVLHRARLARTVLCRRRAAHQQSRHEPRPRSAYGARHAVAPGVLNQMLALSV